MIRFSTKLILLSIFQANFILLLPISLSAQHSDHIATYNIQYENTPEEVNPLSNRTPYAINLIRFHEMDILGPEEGIYNQTEYSSSEFTFPQLDKDSGEKESTHVCSPVYYNPEKFELLENNSFGLSSASRKARNKEEEKICSWGKFKGKDGNKFYVFNVYYHTNAADESDFSKEMILEKINDINKEHLPCILTGDFNVSETSPKVNVGKENSKTNKDSTSD